MKKWLLALLFATSAAFYPTVHAAEFNYLGTWVLTSCEDIKGGNAWGKDEHCATLKSDLNITFRKKLYADGSDKMFEVRYVLDDDILQVTTIDASINSFPKTFKIVDANTLKITEQFATLYKANLTYARQGSSGASKPYVPVAKIEKQVDIAEPSPYAKDRDIGDRQAVAQQQPYMGTWVMDGCRQVKIANLFSVIAENCGNPPVPKQFKFTENSQEYNGRIFPANYSVLQGGFQVKSSTGGLNFQFSGPDRIILSYNTKMKNQFEFSYRREVSSGNNKPSEPVAVPASHETTAPVEEAPEQQAGGLDGFFGQMAPNCKYPPALNKFISDLTPKDKEGYSRLGKANPPGALASVFGKATLEDFGDGGKKFAVPVKGNWKGLPVTAFVEHKGNGFGSTTVRFAKSVKLQDVLAKFPGVKPSNIQEGYEFKITMDSDIGVPVAGCFIKESGG